MNDRNRMTTKVLNPHPHSRQQGQEYAQKSLELLLCIYFLINAHFKIAIVYIQLIYHDENDAQFMNDIKLQNTRYTRIPHCLFVHLDHLGTPG